MGTDKNQDRKEKLPAGSKEKENKDRKNIPMADNAGKLVNSGRSKTQIDKEVKNKITGAEFEGPPY